MAYMRVKIVTIVTRKKNSVVKLKNLKYGSIY